MPSPSAAAPAFARSREAIAAISQSSLICIAGITFSVAILATPSTPHFTLRNAASTSNYRQSAGLWLRRRRAALGLPRQHPARIFQAIRADGVERRNFVRSQRHIRGGEIVVELLKGLRADDDTHDALALQQPGERHAGDRGVVRPGDRRHRVNDVVGTLLVDWREIEDGAARIVVAALLAREFSRKEAAGERAPHHDAEALILDQGQDLAFELAARNGIVRLNRFEPRIA